MTQTDPRPLRHLSEEDLTARVAKAQEVVDEWSSWLSLLHNEIVARTTDPEFN